MVRIENISISFGGKPLLKDVSWRIGDNDRIGLVGPNGSGKTTILRLIQGALTPEKGIVSSSKGTTFGYLPQEALTLSGRTVFDEVMTVFESLALLEGRMRELERQMSEVPADDPAHDRVMTEYSRAQHEFDVGGGFTVEARIAEVLAGLGFAEGDRSRATDGPSPGRADQSP